MFSRSPHGERGLKFIDFRAHHEGHTSRSPHGERGLKYYINTVIESYVTSLPAWGAWIEIPGILYAWEGAYSRSPHGERGLKSLYLVSRWLCLTSLPAWGAWIEILRVCS